MSNSFSFTCFCGWEFWSWLGGGGVGILICFDFTISKEIVGTSKINFKMFALKHYLLYLKTTKLFIFSFFNVQNFIFNSNKNAMINHNMGQYTLAHAIRKQIIYVLCISPFLFYSWFGLTPFLVIFSCFYQLLQLCNMIFWVLVKY